MQRVNARRSKAASLIHTLAVMTLLVSLGVGKATVYAEDKDDTASLDVIRQIGKAFAAVAENASPAVVGIKANQVVSQEYSGVPDWPFHDPFGDDFFERFFRPSRPRRRAPQRKAPRQVQGSGFIVSSDGYILTNNHVVENAEEITITLRDGREFKAKTVGTDPQSEVAVIKVDAEDLPMLELADSDNLKVGEWVIAIGNPFGLSHTVTAGIVSAKGRSNIINPKGYEDFIQTDAAINPGNSGGPLIDLNGKVVGINTAILGPGGNIGIGIGFAIPINMGKFIYNQLVEGGKVVRGALGIQIKDLTPDLAESLDVEGTKGIVVMDVFEGSAAEKAGLERYDVIVELDGEKLDNSNELRNHVAMLKPDTKVEIGIIRNGRQRTLHAVIGEREKELKAAMATEEALEKLGLTIRNLADDLARRYGYEDMSGVIVAGVEPGSEAARVGIQPGMLITEVDREPVANTKEFDEAIAKATENQRVLLLVFDGRHHYMVVLRLPEEDK
jgi:serine protease Do